MAAVRSAVINVMVKAAQRAARSLVRDFGEVEQLQVSRKGPADFVSNADKSAERILREELHKARPSYSMLLEETGRHEGDDPDSVWLVDPLDGTTNFLHGLPVWSISIALEQKGELTAGVVFTPITDELFWAEKGQGAYLNDRRLRVSGRRQLPDALIATGRGTIVPSRSGKYITLERPDGSFFYVGKAGALRFGKTVSDSMAAPDDFKQRLLAEASKTS